MLVSPLSLDVPSIVHLLPPLHRTEEEIKVTVLTLCNVSTNTENHGRTGKIMALSSETLQLTAPGEEFDISFLAWSGEGAESDLW